MEDSFDASLGKQAEGNLEGCLPSNSAILKP